jgi:hypothetical protein
LAEGGFGFPWKMRELNKLEYVSDSEGTKIALGHFMAAAARPFEESDPRLT